MTVKPTDIDCGVAERVGGGEAAQEAEVGGDPEDRAVVERGDQGVASRVAGGAVGDHLAEHRVIPGTHNLSRHECRVDSRAPGPADCGRDPGLVQEPGGRVLGIAPRFDSMPGEAHVLLT